ncbi:MAG TPA: squalene/phytoene synthase family protein [Anaerolineales bacterium]|nr:squalene/phytoene synthase family protein [Anaerolineales bacterium]
MAEMSGTIDRERLDELLVGASRTFAINIPMLPGALRDALTLGYLLLRNADSIEDAYQWPKARRIEGLKELHALILNPSHQAAEQFADRYRQATPLPNSEHHGLLILTPFILDQLNLLPASYSNEVRSHVARVIRRMQDWVASHDDLNHLRLQRLKDLDDYCYSVAGIVGELITSLISIYRPTLEKTRLLFMRTLETACGAGLQLTNIVKDVFRDHLEGRYYIPPDYLPFEDGHSYERMTPMIAYAYRNLCLGAEYACALPVEERQIRMAVLVPLMLAVATLVHLLGRLDRLFSGEELRISREQVGEVLSLAGDVAGDNLAVRSAWKKLSGPLLALTFETLPPGVG